MFSVLSVVCSAQKTRIWQVFFAGKWDGYFLTEFIQGVSCVSWFEHNLPFLSEHQKLTAYLLWLSPRSCKWGTLQPAVGWRQSAPVPAAQHPDAAWNKEHRPTKTVTHDQGTPHYNLSLPLYYLHCAYCLRHQGTLMMEAVRTSETSVYSSNTTRHYIPESYHLSNRRYENLNSHFVHITHNTICSIKLKDFCNHTKQMAILSFYVLETCLQYFVKYL
jgi:hypothetical protein